MFGDVRYAGLMIAAFRKFHEGGINDFLPQLKAPALCSTDGGDH
jgi:hypothetical protein